MNDDEGDIKNADEILLLRTCYLSAAKWQITQFVRPKK